MEKHCSDQLIYQGAIFTFTQDQVQLENGKMVQRDVIHHHGGAGILLLHEQQVLLISQYRYAAQAQLWEIPAGKLEKDEDPLTCVIRELNEETGYECNEVQPLCSFFTTPGFCSERIYLFLGKGAKKAAQRQIMDDDENISIHWFSLNEAYEMILQGTIIDAKTIIAIQQAMLFTQLSK